MKYTVRRDLPNVPLDFVKQLKSKENCTVNTFIMTVISKAIHNYCICRNDPIFESSKVR
jgi:hypothetical protein